MAIIVVGGSGRGVGKTALVCGLIAALPEFRWTVVKITGHEHGNPKPIWEEKIAGQGSDTARYLAAGAERALLVAASHDDLAAVLKELWDKLGPGAHVLYESNRILEHLKPDICLIVDGGPLAERKASFSISVRHADAMAERAGRDGIVDGAKPLFHLVDLKHISPEMLGWLRGRLKFPGVA
jgi:molybdopterin-guanine dinucleotide biosynthesis protein